LVIDEHLLHEFLPIDVQPFSQLIQQALYQAPDSLAQEQFGGLFFKLPE
jgi:hypothetical protein